jgi:mRNA interferase MazF
VSLVLLIKYITFAVFFLNLTNPYVTKKPKPMSMSRFLPGDVVLVSASIDERSGKKIRPAVVITSGEGGELSVCPVSSKPSSDSVSIPLSIDDFASGGLDLFTESYVLASRILPLRSSDVIGKRGRLVPESFAEIMAIAPVSQTTKEKMRR